jgi:two-component system LytT family response regulator
MITALVVDDEAPAVGRLVGMLEEIGDVEVIGTSGSVSEAELFLRERVPDVVFLDMTMPGRQGLDLLPSVDPRTKVVFVTGHENYAIAAFDRGALDYLLKPFDRTRLETAVLRVRAAVGAATPVAHVRTAAAEAAGAESAVRLAIGDKVTIPRERGRTVAVVPLADVAWIEAVQNYSRVQVGGEEPLLVNRSLAAWEELLPIEQFCRVGRSLIVQLARLRSTQWQSRDQTLLFFEGLERPLPVGRTAAARLKDVLRAGDERA